MDLNEVALLGWISADYDVRFWTDLIVFHRLIGFRADVAELIRFGRT